MSPSRNSQPIPETSGAGTPRAWLLIFLGLALAFAPVYLTLYAYNDELFFFAPGYMLNTIASHIGYGRFGFVFIGTVLSALVKSLAALCALRFVNVLLLSICAFLVYRSLGAGARPRSQALLAVLALFTLPAFQSIASNLMDTGAIAAILLCLGSAHFVDKIPFEPSWRRRWGHRYTWWAAGLLFAAYSTYPPGASFYWALPAVMLFGRHQEPLNRLTARLINYFLIGFSALLLYEISLIIIRNSAVVYANDIYNAYAVTDSYLPKIQWFLTEPFSNVLNLWDIFPTASSALAAAGFIAGGACIAVWRLRAAGDREGMRKLVYAAAVMPSLFVLGYLPNLAARYDAAWYRCLTGLTTLVWLILGWALIQWLGLLSQKLRERILTPLLLVVCSYGIVQAHLTVLHYRAIPSHQEISYLKEKFRPLVITENQDIHYIIPAVSSLRHRYDEFGTISSVFPEKPKFVALTACVFTELGRIHELGRYQPAVTFSQAGQNIATTPSMIVVDMRPLAAALSDTLKPADTMTGR